MRDLQPTVSVLCGGGSEKADDRWVGWKNIPGELGVMKQRLREMGRPTEDRDEVCQQWGTWREWGENGGVLQRERVVGEVFD